LKPKHGDCPAQKKRYPLWRRSSPELNDIGFIRLGIIRCINAVDCGRHFLQTTQEVHDELLPHSTYFKSLKSARRMSILDAFERQSYTIHCATLTSQGIDYLRQFPELDEYPEEAADGHFIDHTCHTPKGTQEKVYSVGFIYSMSLRFLLLKPLFYVTDGTRRSHQIPVLKRYIEKNKAEQYRSAKHTYVYDDVASYASIYAPSI